MSFLLEIVPSVHQSKVKHKTKCYKQTNNSGVCGKDENIKQYLD